MQDNRTSVTAFISYSWDSEELLAWVRSLAAHLARLEISVQLDQFDTYVGSYLQDFMSSGIRKSDWIITILSEGYLRKMNDPNTGVGIETDLIEKLRREESILPILKFNPQRVLPAAMSGKKYIDFDSRPYEEAYFDLLKRLWYQDSAYHPHLGQNPFAKVFAHTAITKARVQASTFQNANLTGNVRFDFLRNNGIYYIGTGEFEFATKWSTRGADSIYAYNDEPNISKIACMQRLNGLDEGLLNEEMDFTSRTRIASVGDAIVWINVHGNVAITKINQVSVRSRGALEDVLDFEYTIIERQNGRVAIA